MKRASFTDVILIYMRVPPPHGDVNSISVLEYIPAQVALLELSWENLSRLQYIILLCFTKRNTEIILGFVCIW